MAAQARGKVTINVEECKGCGLCVVPCPPKCLELAPELSSYGVHPARYTGHDCTGCGICFYCCPEPGAISVYRLLRSPKAIPALRGDRAPALYRQCGRGKRRHSCRLPRLLRISHYARQRDR